MDLLRSGDTVRVIAPAGTVDPLLFTSGMDVLKDWGLRVLISEQVLDRDGYFAGSDDARLKALQLALDDRECAAIFCARGGYGTTRILDKADYSGISRDPKWLIGFSDITALHLKMAKLGLPSIHGSMPVQYGRPEHQPSVESLRELLFSGAYSYSFGASTENRHGRATGVLTGGNLALIADSLGTPTEIDTDGRILFLEEVGEDIYRVDRMLQQLRRAGKFRAVTGLLIGHFTSIRDTSPSFGQGIQQLVGETVQKDIPLAFGFPSGHEAPNLSLLLGKEHELWVGESCLLRTL